MRRFEFTKGTSNKFWEIGRSGSDVTTRWGRVGTNGQTKTKSLPDPAQADADMAKQIRGKEKKGYLEVESTDGAPMATDAPEPTEAPAPSQEPEQGPQPQPTAAPAPAPAPVSPTGAPPPFIEPHDHPVSALRGVSPPPPPIDPSEALAAMQLSASKIAEARKPNKLSPAQQALLDEAVAVLTSAEAHVPERLELEAFTGALVDMIDTWILQRGPLFAIQAQLESCRVSVSWSGAFVGPPRFDLHRWRRLRAHAVASDDPTWRAIQDFATARFPQEQIPNQTALAYVTADPSLARQVVAKALARQVRPPPCLLALIGLLDTSSATELARAHPIPRGMPAGDLLEAHGLGAVGPLMAVIQGVEFGQDAFPNLVLIHSDGSAKALVQLLDHTVLRSAAAAALRDRPGFALPALAQGRSTAARELLRQIAFSHPPQALAVLPTLTGDAARRLEAALPGDEPPTDAPPALLVDPPWATRPKASKPIVIRLTPKEGPPEAIVWQGDEQERFAKRRGGWSDRHAYLRDLATKGLEAFDTIAGHNFPAEVVAGCYRVRSSRLAERMAHAYAHLKSVRKEALTWLESFPEAAAVPLVPQALGKAGKARRAAEKALRATDRTIVLEVAQRYGDDALAAIESMLDADPLVTELPRKMPTLPAGLDAAGLLPARALDGRPLPPEAVHNLVLMAAISTADQPYAGLEKVEAELDPDSLARFAWSLFLTWYLAGAEGKQDWALACLGRWGDDQVARELTTFLKKWPGESAHARAVKGLDVLAGIGSDVALMLLHGLSLKLRYKGLKKKAGEKIEEIARDRGLSPVELADRLVPDCGLDPTGATILDFGPRQFTVGFDEHLKPFVRDDTGKQRASLPKPGKKDDADLSKAASARWKAIKKDVRSIASAQVARLELAMCSQRRWTVDVFRTFLLDHPLMIHLVRRLLWGAWKEGQLVSTFRVTDDRTLANIEDEDFVLSGDVEVGLPHPLGLDAAVVTAWGEVFADYEIIPPFPQLARDTYRPTATEAESRSLDRVAGRTVPWGKVIGLEKLGWEKGFAQDAGWIWDIAKPLSEGGGVALELKTGLASWSLAESEDQELGSVSLYGGSGKVTFGQLDPVAFSELIRDLNSLE